MSGNKWEQMQKAKREAEAKAAEERRKAGVKTGATGGLAEKRASVQAGLVPKTPGQGQAQVQSAPRAASGPVAAKFGDKGPSSPKSSVKAKSVASALEGQMGGDAEARRKRALAMAQASRAQQEAEAGQTHATVKAPTPPSSPKPKAASPQQQQQGGLRFDAAAARQALRPTSAPKSAPASETKPGSGKKTGGYDPKRKI